LYHTKGQYDQAIVTFDKALGVELSRKFNDGSIGLAILVLRGKAFEAKGDRAKAIEEYNKALAPRDYNGEYTAKARQRLAELQAVAPPPAAGTSAPAPLATAPSRRVALVIGNAASSYFNRDGDIPEVSVWSR
jgi:tetratricopeptide (TPR) repeat protein